MLRRKEQSGDTPADSEPGRKDRTSYKVTIPLVEPVASRCELPSNATATNGPLFGLWWKIEFDVDEEMSRHSTAPDWRARNASLPAVPTSPSSVPASVDSSASDDGGIDGEVCDPSTMALIAEYPVAPTTRTWLALLTSQRRTVPSLAQLSTFLPFSTIARSVTERIWPFKLLTGFTDEGDWGRESSALRMWIVKSAPAEIRTREDGK